VRRPQVIDDEDHEQVHERVAAIDVAKDSGMVCTRTPHPPRPGGRRSTVWTVKARKNAIGALGRQLARDGIEVVTLESTSDYWRIWFFVLEVCGLAVQLVNAAQAKNLPGRPKTDKLDAQWLARLTEMGLLRASFVPPKAVRDLRDYTRARARLVQERTRCFQRMEKLLEGALVKVSSVASKLTTLSAQDMIKAMIAGQRDPKALAGLARGKMGGQLVSGWSARDVRRPASSRIDMARACTCADRRAWRGSAWRGRRRPTWPSTRRTSAWRPAGWAHSFMAT
jgi:transposase